MLIPACILSPFKSYWDLIIGQKSPPQKSKVMVKNNIMVLQPTWPIIKNEVLKKPGQPIKNDFLFIDFYVFLIFYDKLNVMCVVEFFNYYAGSSHLPKVIRSLTFIFLWTLKKLTLINVHKNERWWTFIEFSVHINERQWPLKNDERSVNIHNVQRGRWELPA